MRRALVVAAMRPGPGRGSLLVSLGAALLVAACSFGSDRPKPKPLEAITTPLAVKAAWHESVGRVQFPLTVAINGGVFTMATTDGNVIAVEAETGRIVWRTNVGARISAGVGGSGSITSVVTRDGDLVVLDNGQVKWKKPLGTRVATAPLVAGGRIFVLGVDRAVQAFDADDGSKLWQVARPGDPLTLAQSGVIAAFDNTLLVGQGPRLAGIDPVAAQVRWEVPIGSPRGANEVERLADLIGPALRVGDLVCARSFQAAVGCVNASRGAAAWAKTIGGTEAIAGDAELVFAADASDRLTAWRTASGDVAWTSEALMFRQLGAPAAFAGSVVYGDVDGTLHWLSRAKGEAQARTPTDGSGIVVAPIVVGGTLVVVTRGGGLYAFKSG